MRINNTTNWLDAFPKSDLSESITTQKLLDAWYLLGGNDHAVLVDTVKPRLFKIFSFGKYGTLQQLLCDMECCQEAGRSGIRAVYYKNGTKYTMLKDRPYIFEDTPHEGIEFNPEKSSVTINGVQCYDQDLKPDDRMDMQVSLEKNGFIFAYKAPEGSDVAAVEVELYPLYTDYRATGWDTPELIDYFSTYLSGRRGDLEARFCECVNGYVELHDRHGRMPQLIIEAPRMQIKLTAFCDQTRNDAYRLRLELTGSSTGEILFRLKQNPITVNTQPIIAAGAPHQIQITCWHKPSVTIAGHVYPTYGVGPNRWESTIVVPHGISHMLVESADGVTDRHIAGVSDIPGWIAKMGKAAAASLWPDGPLSGLMPQFIDVRRLGVKVRGAHGKSKASIGYCSHNPRALMIIAAAALQMGDEQLLARAWSSLEKMVHLAYKHADGALVLPIILLPDGRPDRMDAVRPSDPAIAIRSLLMIRAAFEAWGDTERANKALEYAKGFALTLMKMAGPQGELESRYRYPSLEVTARAQIPGRGTVNNWVTNIWEFAQILKSRKDPLGAKLEELCIKHVDLLIASKPSVLRLAGGGEDGPNNSDALNATAGFFLVKYLATGDDTWLCKAKQAFIMAALSNTIIHIDQPQNNFFTFDWTESIWRDGPMSVQSKGGMHDLTSCDVGLFLAYYANDIFARDMCFYQFLARLVDGVYENGAVLGHVTSMPNFQYAQTDFSETLNFGAVGVMALYMNRGMRRLCQ